MKMAVESAKFIKQLDASLPLGGDSISEGDNHIRVIKEAVTGSFPNIDSVVTATPAELNEVGNIKAELDAFGGKALTAMWPPVITSLVFSLG
jgi:hypothetical protein